MLMKRRILSLRQLQMLSLSLATLFMLSPAAADAAERKGWIHGVLQHAVSDDPVAERGPAPGRNRGGNPGVSAGRNNGEAGRRGDWGQGGSKGQAANSPGVRAGVTGNRGSGRRGNAWVDGSGVAVTGVQHRRRDDGHDGWRQRQSDRRGQPGYRHTHHNHVTVNHIYWAPRRHWVDWYVPLTHAGRRYYYNNGAFYRHNGLGFTYAGENFGIYLYSLPFGYRTVFVDDYPYYYFNRHYYIRDHARNRYLRVDDPYASAGYRPAQTVAAQYRELYVYPSAGQSPGQMDQDKYECHRWAVAESGFDPSLGKPGDYAEYRRAQCACLEGRGYTVN
jgi:hypothetical protein